MEEESMVFARPHFERLREANKKRFFAGVLKTIDNNIG
jgi:hypothetical protein